MLHSCGSSFCVGSLAAHGGFKWTIWLIILYLSLLSHLSSPFPFLTHCVFHYMWCLPTVSHMLTMLWESEPISWSLSLILGVLQFSGPHLSPVYVGDGSGSCIQIVNGSMFVKFWNKHSVGLCWAWIVCSILQCGHVQFSIVWFYWMCISPALRVFQLVWCVVGCSWQYETWNGGLCGY